jgi:hypothetical protein
VARRTDNWLCGADMVARHHAGAALRKA